MGRVDRGGVGRGRHVRRGYTYRHVYTYYSCDDAGGYRLSVYIAGRRSAGCVCVLYLLFVILLRVSCVVYSNLECEAGVSSLLFVKAGHCALRSNKEQRTWNATFF